MHGPLSHWLTPLVVLSLAPLISTQECPDQPAVVGEWTWLGCYTEATNARALSAKTFADDDMALDSCATFCEGYTYFGTEYGRECYCGNSFNAGSVEAEASQCNMRCAGSECTLCGAGNRLSVYTKGGTGPETSSTGPGPGSTTTSGTPPIPTGFPEGWDPYGCWVDGANGRILNYQAPDNAQLTLQLCVQLCDARGYIIAGAEYGVQCFCGNSIVNGGERADSDSECNVACGGNTSQDCGGGSRMNIFARGEPQVVGPPAPIPSLDDWVYQGRRQASIPTHRWLSA